MKKNIILFSAIVFSGLSFGQVGINNETPKATLDITAKATDGTTAEGIIAPRLTGDQIQAKDSKYGAEQKAAIVYALSAVTTSSTKTTNITSEGYYYFDGALWQKLVNASGGNTLYSANGTLSENRTVTMGGKTLQFTGGNVGIGTENPKRLFHLSANDVGTPSMLALDNVAVPAAGATSNGMSVSFRGTMVDNGVNTTFTEFAAIQAGFENHNKATIAGSIRFHTIETNAQNVTSVKERVRISKEGYLGVGTAVPTSKLQVVGLLPFASDAAAGAAGLTTGAFYQTSGTGEGIFATLGVLMVKQ